MNAQEIVERRPKQWIERLARFGYAAKGVVYGLVGVLAFLAAVNWGGQATSSEGAFLTVASQPFGKVLLILIALGLIGYVVWQFVQAAIDPEHNDSGWHTLGRRLSYAAGGMVYGGLVMFALRVVFNQPTNGSDASGQQAAMLLSQPFGQWLVGAMGAAFLSYGCFYFYRAYATHFRRHLNLASMSAKEVMWSTRIGRFGMVAKGIVAIIMGYFFIQAGISADPNQAKNTEGALQTLQQQPYGGWLMGLVALGLVAYGIHMGVQARYRRISP
jgi:hypothetical protein